MKYANYFKMGDGSQVTLSPIGNTLFGKKWTVLGDSFSAKGYDDDDTTVHQFTDGLYSGCEMVYPYYIARRNNMNIVQLAVGGMTLSNPDGTRTNAICRSNNPVYENIPSDTDYITIKIGINDSNISAPVGSIDDIDATTFYGAYNMLMSYITTNFPFAHVGIICTNGLDDNYSSSGAKKTYYDPTVAIAKKWGIPYLDEAHDPTVPLLHRTIREGLSETAYNNKLENFRISSTNTHPNNKAHEFESFFVEEWLRRI